MTGAERIAAERQRQIEQEGWTAEHDDQHTEGELAWAAVCYAAPGWVFRRAVSEREETLYFDPWPETWGKHWDKRCKHSRIRELEIAGALIAAEIDRLLRKRETP